ncbi:MAG: cytochrome C [Rhizobacter sp.]|nr:cytochrome C [Rhizobacter sp.]
MAASASEAFALPSFARQTGFECVACHVSWPELTRVGRQFKLGGYTLMKDAAAGERPLASLDRDGPAPLVPFAAFAQASFTRTAKTATAGEDESLFPAQDRALLQQLSVFLAGRVADHVGAFAQWSYDGVAHHSAVDNVDIRAASRYSGDGLDLAWGVSLNNSPTVSDIFNSTPVWGFPFASSSVAPRPAAATLVEGGLAQQVAGLSVYSMWNQSVYAELGGYRTAEGVFSALRAGVDRSTAAVLRGTAPYGRLALQREWDDGTQSAMIGTFGLRTRKYPDPLDPSGATDTFGDVGVDAQYQYITDAHRVSREVSYIHERQDLEGTFGLGNSASLHNSLSTLSSKVTYYYQGKYGATLGFHHTWGDADGTLYPSGVPMSGSANGRPDWSAIIVELNWLPWRDRRFSLQYTAYEKFNGGRTNYDGFGRNARDNNTLYLVAWFAF